jgi:hypothetical protein
MKFPSRKLQAAEPATTDGPQRIVYREIEISVEREWTVVTSRGHSTDGVQAPPGGEPEAEQALKQLPPPKRE